MLRKVAEKLGGSRGETIAESLVSMLIIVLAGLMLAGAILSSARVNHASKKIAVFPQYHGETVDNTRTASITGSLQGDVSVSTSVPVTMYRDLGEMYYYEKR